MVSTFEAATFASVALVDATLDNLLTALSLDLLETSLAEGLLDPAALASFVKVLLFLAVDAGLDAPDLSRLYIRDGRTSAEDFEDATVLVGACGISGTEERSSFWGPSMGPNTELGLVASKEDGGGGGALNVLNPDAGAFMTGAFPGMVAALPGFQVPIWFFQPAHPVRANPQYNINIKPKREFIPRLLTQLEPLKHDL